MRDPRDPRNKQTARPLTLALAILVDAPLPGRARIGLSPPLSEAASVVLERAILADLFSGLTMVPLRHRLIVAPPDREATDALADVAHDGWKIMPRRGDDPRAHLVGAFEDLFALGVQASVVVTTSSPILPVSELYEGMSWMVGANAKGIVGSSSDGRCYALGSTRFDARLLEGIDPFAPSSADSFRANAAKIGIERRSLPTIESVRVASDLPRLARDLAGAGASSATETARLLATPAFTTHCI